MAWQVRTGSSEPCVWEGGTKGCGGRTTYSEVGQDRQGDIELSLVAVQTVYAFEFYLNHCRNPSYKAMT